MNQKHALVILLIAVFIAACRKEYPIKDNLEKFLGFQKPINFPEPAYAFANNPVTKAGFELGRALFYEPRLSRDNTISCGSCHIQSAAFTQHGHDVSHGIDDRLGTRNSPPIMNLAWNKAFMWAGGVYDLDLQPIVPITAHEEMDEDLKNVYQKLEAMPKYQHLFKAAFGSAEIGTTVFMKALSQFMLMCVSSDSRYDQVMRKENGASFSATELEGYQLFQQKCSACHREPLFTDGSFRNNGLGISPVNDQGLYTATLKEADRYKFKVPSLRNLSYTAPYMHDGRFLSLSAVLEHYHSEVQPTQNLDPALIENGQRGISLSAGERAALLAFLKTLDDVQFIHNTNLSEQ